VAWFVVKEAQVRVLGEELRSPVKTTVVSTPSDDREDDMESGLLCTCCLLATVCTQHVTGCLLCFAVLNCGIQ